MINTVIFDMDGVIIDTETVHLGLEKELFKELGIPVSTDEHHSYIGTSEINMWEMVCKNHEIELDIPFLLKKKMSRYHEYLLYSELRAIEGVIELIHRLKIAGYKLALASSAHMESIKIITVKLRIAEYFLEILSGADMEYSKPHPAIFLKVAGELGSSPSSCLVIEDSENGVKAAKNAGMFCIGFDHENIGKMNLSGADAVVYSFDQINLELIEKLQEIH
ncbi:MAG: HAD family hydrolase [bacterium]